MDVFFLWMSEKDVHLFPDRALKDLRSTSQTCKADYTTYAVLGFVLCELKIVRDKIAKRRYEWEQKRRAMVRKWAREDAGQSPEEDNIDEMWYEYHENKSNDSDYEDYLEAREGTEDEQ